MRVSPFSSDPALCHVSVDCFLPAWVPVARDFSHLLGHELLSRDLSLLDLPQTASSWPVIKQQSPSPGSLTPAFSPRSLRFDATASL